MSSNSISPTTSTTIPPTSPIPKEATEYLPNFITNAMDNNPYFSAGFGLMVGIILNKIK